MNIKVNSTDQVKLFSETKYLSSYKIKIKSKHVTKMSINIINGDAPAKAIIKYTLQSITS